MRSIRPATAVLLAAALTASGCAPAISGAMNAGVTQDEIRIKTAKYFGTSTSNVTISAVEKGLLATAYRTRYRGTLYNCSLYYGTVNCKRPGD